MSIPTVWKLRDRKVVVRRYTSGQTCDYSVRIMWSPKLGLTHSSSCLTYEAATRLAQRIVERGAVDTTHWTSHAYPHREYLHDSACD